MFCSNCGKQYEDGAAFCPNCGAATAPAQQAAPQPTYTAPAYTAPSYEAPASLTPSWKEKFTIPVIVALVASLLIALCCFLPYLSADSKYAKQLEKYGDEKILPDCDLTCEEMIDVNLFEAAQVADWYNEKTADMDDDDLEDLSLVPIAIYAILILGLAAAACTYFDKIYGLIGCAAGALLLKFFVDGKFEDADLLDSSSSYDSGIGDTLLIIACVVAIGAGAWIIYQAKKNQDA